ncbi:uncharacterized protein LOC124777027 [Schistocerca piceifrons]|uniref:uncharacterized protein LOC124777027 n=1 Tax=Schistocerca piceifrons TaxID=274613 RepID=UPI001F5F1BC0|nr:uncharacterized protein LOC124777027 [Schistocerca piceifrons]
MSKGLSSEEIMEILYNYDVSDDENEWDIDNELNEYMEPLHKDHIIASDEADDEIPVDTTHSREQVEEEEEDTRAQRIEETKYKLQAVRVVFDKFQSNLCKNFYPYEYVTTDERLAMSRGKCPFRVYMKSKPGKYGIKIWICAEVKTSYLLRTQIYTGMVDNTREVNQEQRVILDLMEPFLNNGHGVTTDNFLTSFPLAAELLKRNTTLVGTLRSNKKDIPK